MMPQSMSQGRSQSAHSPELQQQQQMQESSEVQEPQVAQSSTMLHRVRNSQKRQERMQWTQQSGEECEGEMGDAGGAPQGWESSPRNSWKGGEKGWGSNHCCKSSPHSLLGSGWNCAGMRLESHPGVPGRFSWQGIPGFTDPAP